MTRLLKTSVVADLRAKYPQVRRVLKWSKSERPAVVVIQCPKLCASCKRTRQVHTQDLFQVKFCTACKKWAKKHPIPV